MTPEQINHYGDELYNALLTRTTVPPLLGRAEGITIEHAYRIQERMVSHRLKAGEKIVGKKIGVTSKAVQDRRACTTRKAPTCRSAG
jgi:2-oxopent-4-enoate/cis-2-oxohex-4-enoate hydratase